VKRDEFFRWIKSVDSEYRAAKLAVSNLRDEARRGSKDLTSAGLVIADVQHCLANLEATYVVRLFAEFESALRIYWGDVIKRKTSPQISKLISSLAASRGIPNSTADYVHEVRKFRNRLVHEEIQSAILTFGACRSYLSQFLSFLPPQW
jgi:hypothetical protein